MRNRMFEVFYNGQNVGLVVANDNTVGKEAEKLCQACTVNSTGALYGSVIDPKLITWTDKNAAKYQHML